MPVTLTLTSIDVTQNQIFAEGTAALTGTYPTNGDAVSFASLGIPSNSAPSRVEFYEATPSPGPASGWEFIYLPGTGQAGLLEAFNGTTQFTTQAYGTPAFGITGFVLRWRAWFAPFI